MAIKRSFFAIYASPIRKRPERGAVLAVFNPDNGADGSYADKAGIGCDCSNGRFQLSHQNCITV